MKILSVPGWARQSLAALAVASLLLFARTGQAASVPSPLIRSFAFPVTFANGLTADLVVPAGSTTSLRFDMGKVAIGELPVPLPEGPRGRGQRRSGREFVRPAAMGSHARLLLTGVADGDGHPVTNTGNELLVDAVVSPSSAATSAPPFVVPFDIANGVAFVDALLPIQPTADGSVRMQVLGATILDPDGQPFGVLGFQLSPARPTPAPRGAPTPGGAPPPCGAGQCFDTIAFRCTGQACGPNLHCPLPNQLCDVSGNRCPCSPTPPAHGRVCCQCKDTPHACFDLSFVEVQPICPPGCETHLGSECDPSGNTCVPLTPCTADTDCNDGNGCTIDRCTADGCLHDCVCLGPMGCGPGPGRVPHP